MREHRAAIRAVVLAGGDPVGRARGAARRSPDDAYVVAADSGSAPRRDARPARRLRRRRLSIRPTRPRSTRPRARARSSSVIPPRRTRPISSSRSTSPQRPARAAIIVVVGGAAAASTTSSPTSRCSRRRASPTSRSRRSCGDGARHGRARRRPPSRSRARRATSSRCCRSGGPARGITTTGLQYPLHGEDLAPGNDARRQQRARRRRRRSVVLEHGTLLVIQPVRRCAMKRARSIAASRCALVAARGRVQRRAASARARPDVGGRRKPSTTVVLLTHDSFAASKQVLADFTAQTGYKVKLVQPGDAGDDGQPGDPREGQPVADAFFGVDNTFLTRALDAGHLRSVHVDGPRRRVPAALQLDPEHRVTPIDDGDVCVELRHVVVRSRRPPARADVARRPHRPAYKNLTVVENAATSSPGLAFLLATIAAYGENGWQRLLDARCAPTACASSTTGRRPTRPTSPRAAGAATGRSSCRTRRSRGRRRRLEPAPRRRRPSASSRRRASGRWSSPACSHGAQNPAGRAGARSTSC